MHDIFLLIQPRKLFLILSGKTKQTKNFANTKEKSILQAVYIFPLYN